MNFNYLFTLQNHLRALRFISWWVAMCNDFVQLVDTDDAMFSDDDGGGKLIGKCGY